MVPTYKSIFTALVITLINQCLAKTTCNSDCMFYDHNKSVLDYDEFKHCTASSLKVLTLRSKFMGIFNSTHYNSTKYGFSGKLNYALLDIAYKYSYRFNHKEIV